MTGGELRVIRRRLGLTQTALAEKLSVTANTVARWERDVVPIRDSMDKLIRLFAKAEGRLPGKSRKKV